MHPLQKDQAKELPIWSPERKIHCLLPRLHFICTGESLATEFLKVSGVFHHKEAPRSPELQKTLGLLRDESQQKVGFSEWHGQWKCQRRARILGR